MSSYVVAVCSWILTWFTRSSDKGQDAGPVMRMWDYLICSQPSSIIFLISTILLEEYPEGKELPDPMIEMTQHLKSYQFSTHSVERIIHKCEKLRYKFCLRSDWVHEFNSNFGRDSKYRIKYLGWANSLSRRVSIVSIITVLILSFLIMQLGYGPKIQYALTTFFRPVLALFGSFTNNPSIIKANAQTDL